MQQRERLGSRLGFILLSAGCAIGLGNVYRFPIWTGAYGGGIFLLFYLLFLILLGIPVMTVELAVGRASQRSIATSFDVLEKPGQKWHWMKGLGVAGNYLLMMFSTTISGWFVVYFGKYLNGSILQHTTAEALGGVFGSIVTNPALNISVTIVVIVLCFGVCAIGLEKGVEKITKVMMVLLLALILGLGVYACTLPGAGAGLKFYLVPSTQTLKGHNIPIGTVISAAMSQAFFTLSLGIGSIAIFGSYIKKDRSLLGETVTIVSLDTFVALMSGLVIFPAYFTFNPGTTGIGADQAGAGFLFTTLSSIFNNMAAGRLIGTLFFLFMVFAAFSTVIAVFENIMSFWLEWTKLKRWQIALINIAALSALTLPFIYSNVGGVLAEKVFLGRNFGDFEDFLVSNIALPVGSLVYVLFCTSRYGWGWKNYFAEVNTGKGAKMPKWTRVYMSLLLPLIILVVLVMSVLPTKVAETEAEDSHITEVQPADAATEAPAETETADSLPTP
ncbi:MAG: sodium-dependent transporter [Candidatus Faecivicinus sp.]|nr:sodium-dependent transporter [Candidatus Faecivicinus sp.]